MNRHATLLPAILMLWPMLSQPTLSPEPTRSLKGIPRLTDAYRKAHKAYVLASGLLTSWELIGITLDTKGKWGLELKSPNAVPLILFTLVLYSGYKMIIEWLQCEAEENKVAKLDYWIAHSIAFIAILISVIQYLAKIQIINFLVPALSFFIVGVAAVGFVRSLSQVRTLRLTRGYLAFCAIAGGIQLAFWLVWRGVNYNVVYWALELAHNVLLCFLSAEIIKALLPRRFAILWSGIALATPLIMLIVNWPLKLPVALLNLSTSASFVGGILLLSLFFISVNWTKEHRLATAGVTAILFGDLVSSFGDTGHIGPGRTSALQLAPLLGLILLSLAGRSKRADKLKRENVEKPPEMPSQDLASGATRA
jgi:hypothetical protein